MDIITKPTVQALLKTLNGNALALDVAKNHTGICMWYDNILYTFGFELDEYDETDVHAEYKMRKSFKDKLIAVLNNRVFEYVIIENVYGGVNFDTVRKLLALQTVIDEIIFEGKIVCKKFYRWKQTEWARRARQIYKQNNRLKSKYETQNLLEYLEFDFYMQNKDKSNADKEKIYFEDICDACGMLMAVVADVNFNTEQETTINKKFITVKYIQDLEHTGRLKDEIVKNAIQLGTIKKVDVDSKRIDKDIYSLICENPNSVMYADLPSRYLGSYGLTHKFTFFPSGGCLVFYYKKGTFI